MGGIGGGQEVGQVRETGGWGRGTSKRTSGQTSEGDRWRTGGGTGGMKGDRWGIGGWGRGTGEGTGGWGRGTGEGDRWVRQVDKVGGLVGRQLGGQVRGTGGDR